ncbi:hypothetical protein P691DRAFT_781109 [Macrolepiota fuliginosa MF-IS2]|uniref:Uncharacterized protein n=1 Tax=Macrolepiota fuliginosa MF-IS2 TaxID=1400762 RepID=A0A9P5WYY9_9AGAR|nr:hypothetical protein P691DRAFT_781109 [Macrolepiota fuliginosa MF-IS2]
MTVHGMNVTGTTITGYTILKHLWHDALDEFQDVPDPRRLTGFFESAGGVQLQIFIEFEPYIAQSVADVRAVARNLVASSGWNVGMVTVTDVPTSSNSGRIYWTDEMVVLVIEPSTKFKQFEDPHPSHASTPSGHLPGGLDQGAPDNCGTKKYSAAEKVEKGGGKATGGGRPTAAEWYYIALASRGQPDYGQIVQITLSSERSSAGGS